MNTEKLKIAEQKFLQAYPQGFADPVMAAMAKKHKVDKMHKFALDSFAASQFKDSGSINTAITKMISQSSLVSVFEKARFRDVIKSVPDHEREMLAAGLGQFLHGDQEIGFQVMADLLGAYKMAKWPLLTAIPYYYRPEFEVFMKPTTVKGVIEFFELKGLKYSPKPTYPFYRDYRQQILEMKRTVSIKLGFNDNAAFCGFLMMSLENPPVKLPK
ncbi:MAG: hypothetical protein ABRQ23_09355 [Syntrophomonadaceae bacterium]